jgi:hypothetical protein
MTACTPTHRPDPRGRARLPATIAVIVAIAGYAALQNRLLLGPRYVIPGLEVILFVPLILANPRRMSRQNRLRIPHEW